MCAKGRSRGGFGDSSRRVLLCCMQEDLLQEHAGDVVVFQVVEYLRSVLAEPLSGPSRLDTVDVSSDAAVAAALTDDVEDAAATVVDFAAFDSTFDSESDGGSLASGHFVCPAITSGMCSLSSLLLLPFKLMSCHQ